MHEIASRKSLPDAERKAGNYEVSLATSDCDIHAAQELRFEVFNLELNEGLADSYTHRRDQDDFDKICDHLIVRYRPTNQVVGTYRLQSGPVAAGNLGYYSQQEFDLSPFEPLRAQIIELGRACVHRSHRNMSTLALLWKGIAHYARKHNARYLLGCSSMTSQSPEIGASAYSEFCRHYLAAPEFLTHPWPACECPLQTLSPKAPEIPRLLRAYLTVGAKICAPPAIDREFGTIDFLTLLDLDNIHPAARAKFLGDTSAS